MIALTAAIVAPLWLGLFHYDTVLLSHDGSDCTLWCHFIKMSVEKVIYAVLCVFSSACFMWCKSKDACPYFSFQHRHLAHLHSPNFSFFFFSSANYSWPTKPYPPTPFLSPSNGAELRFLHVVVESGRGERGAAVARTWELSEREDMTQICLLAS